MNSSPVSGSARQRARKQGLARISALTLGVGAAGVLGAVAIAVTLPGSTAAVSANAATVTTTTSTTTGDDDSSDDDSGSQQQTQQLQTTTAPSTTIVPPVVTSGAS